MADTVLVDLNWTLGVNTPAGVRYFGPGRVPVPAEIARRMGWKPVESEEETAVPEIVRARTPVPLTGDVAAAAGISHLRGALVDAGFLTAAGIAQAGEKELTAVSGVGKATAARLKAAATQLLAGDNP